LGLRFLEQIAAMHCSGATNTWYSSLDDAPNISRSDTLLT